ncbi:hypothetical protein LTR17_021995 [Elasticomyces elasticus]|nr:hypothetical protein LTR17_021995 [Elasticomyces elasticus]
MAILEFPPRENGAPPATATPSPAIPVDPANPIDPARFATALEALPLDALHSKAAEVRNSMVQLRNSNEQMVPFADAGDDDCREAMFENLQVIARMNGRLVLLKREVERRGQVWHTDPNDLRDETEEEDGMEGLESNGLNGTNGQHATVNGGGGSNEAPAPRAPSGRLTDEELRRQLEAQMGGDEDDDGVHL